MCKMCGGRGVEHRLFYACLLTFKSIINGFKIELLGFSDDTSLEMAEHLRIHM